MPCEIRVEVVYEVDFLQVLNTTLHATTMDVSLIGHRKHMYLFGSNKDGNYPTFLFKQMPTCPFIITILCDAQ
jgi:hypothetical protein